MIRNLDPATERFLNALGSIDARLERANRQLTSGLKISSASDAPDQVSPLLTVRAQLEEITQIKANLARVKTETDVAEEAVRTAVKRAERALTLGVQGANSTQTPAQRATLAQEVSAILENLVNLSNASVEGRYIFGGDQGTQAPYSYDDSIAANPVVQEVAGLTSTRQILLPGGSLISIAHTATEVFDAPGDGIFAAVNALRVALLNGPTVPEGDPAYSAQFQAQTAAIDAAVTNLRAAHNHLSGELSYYGTRQNRVDGALSSASTMELQFKTELSSIQDADLAEAAMELMQATTHREAAMEARVRTPRQTLFDYLG